MFKIGNVPKSEIYSLAQSAATHTLSAVIEGLKADRLVKKNLIDFEKIKLPGASSAFKITYPHTKDRAVIIKIADDGQLIKVWIDSENPKAFSGSNFEFSIYPTHELSTAKQEDIIESVRTQLFMLAYILLKLSSGYDFHITRDKVKLNTNSPAVALYEACIDTTDTSILSYSEPDMYESDDRSIVISKDKGLIQISGDGVSPLTITLTEIFAKMLGPALIVEYAA